MKAAKALKEKGDTPEELLQSIKENEAAVAEAQRTVDAWKAIAGERKRRAEEAERVVQEKAEEEARVEAEKKAEAERKAEEEQRAAEEKRIAEEKAEAERKAQEERERAEVEERDRIEAELDAQKADEEARLEAERKAEEEAVEKDAELKEDKKKPQIKDVVKTIYEKGKAVASKLFGRSFFDVAKTPDFMKKLGLTGDRFTIKYGVLSRHAGKDASHLLTEKQWEELPDAIQKPFAITRFGEKENGYRLYTTMKNDKGETIVVGVDVKNIGRNLEVNSISTIFGRRGDAKITQKEEVLYTDEKITPEQRSLLGQPNSDQYTDTRERNVSTDKGSEKAEKKQEKQSVFDKAKEIADKEEKKRKAEDDKPKQKPLTEAERKDAEAVAGKEKIAEEQRGYLDRLHKESQGNGIRVGKHEYASVDDMADFIKAHNKAATETMNDMKSGKLTGAQTRELAVKAGGFTFDVKTILAKETAWKGGGLFAEVHRKMTYSCKKLGLDDVPVKQSLLRNALTDIMENVLTGKDFKERIEAAEQSAEHNRAELEQIKKREGKPFEFEKELEKAKAQLTEYTDAMKKELAEKDAKYAKMDAEVEEASGVAVDEEDGELYRDGELERVNEEFNNRLSSLAANRNQKDRVLKLGRPSRFLIDGGVTDAEIILEFDKLARKSDDGYKNEHPFDVMDVENLPLAIAYPIAVFDNTNGYSSGKVILTELEKDGRNFIVVVQTISQRRKGGVVLEVNRIDTLFPKEERGIVNWFNKGLASNIDKEKALRFIKALPNHPGTITKEELLSATKEVKNFEFSKSSDVDRLVGALKDKTDFELYNRLTGEVEARNTEKRIGMTEEERRASLASETEDVAREDQILLRQGLDGIDDIMRSEAAATPLKGDEALTALDSIFGENEGSAIPPKISSFAKFKNLFKKPVRTFLGELVQAKDEVWNKILRNNRQDITGTVLPTIENADFAIRDTDGSTLYVKRFKGDGQERMYNVMVVNKHGEVEDYISSVHIKRDNNLRNKIKKGAELFLPNARTTDGTMSRNNSTPGAKVANYSETAKPRYSRKPGESIFNYASRVSEDVDRSVRERVSARDEYEKKVKSKGFQTKEALQNSMLGLQEFMYAIDHASGNKRYIEDIPNFENPILGENRLSSVNKEESHSRLDAVHSPTPTKGVRKPYLRSYTIIYMPLADILFPRMYQTPDGFMAVRIQHVEFVIQTYETEFSSEIFLWRESQRHQNPNLGDADCESSADGDAEGIETTMELLRTDYYGQDNTDVLRLFLQPVQQPRKGMGYHSFQGFRCTF